MKKILLSVIAFSFAITSNSQTIFSHDFENGSIAPMTIVDNDGLTPHSNVSFVNAAWVNYAMTSSNKAAVSTSWYSPAGTADDWLITPALTINAATTVLRWKGLALSGSYPDGYEVKISTTTNALASFTTTLFTTSAESASSWADRQESLAAYNGMTVYIAFVNNSNDKIALAIDDIFVGTPTGYDLGVKGLSGLNSIEMVGSKTFDIEFFNFGGDTVTAFDYSVSIGGNVSNYSVTGVSVAPYASHVVTNPSYSFTDTNNLPISIYIDSIPGQTDLDLTNDTLSVAIKVFPSIPNFTLNDSHGGSHDLYTELQAGKVVVIDFFASWCGPCQSSTPALNDFYEEWGAGGDMVKVYGMTVESNDDNAVVNGLGWGATYPKFAYTQTNDDFYYHFAINHGLNTGGSIPFFVMICPNTSDVKNSTVIQSDAGYGAGMFTNSYSPKVQVCQPSAGNHAGIEAVDKELANSLAIFPNPTSGIANVTFEVSSTSDVVVSVYSSTGKLVENLSLGSQVGSQKVELSTEKYEAGVYTVQVKMNGLSYSKRLTVIK